MEFSGLNLIVACNRKGLIGVANKMCWHIPEELAYFKRVTQNGIVVMGSNTFASLGYRPLKERLNLVLSSKLKAFEHPNVTILANLQELESKLAELNSINRREVFIIGGAQVYREFLELNIIARIYLTIVEYHPSQILKEPDEASYFPYTLEQLLNLKGFEMQQEATRILNCQGIPCYAYILKRLKE